MNETEEGKESEQKVFEKETEKTKYASLFKENGDYLATVLSILVVEGVLLSLLLENPIEFLINHIGSIIQIIIGIIFSFVGMSIILRYRKRSKIYIGLILLVFSIILTLSGLGLLLIQW